MHSTYKLQVFIKFSYLGVHVLPTKLRSERCANDLNHFQLKVPSGTFSIAEISQTKRFRGKFAKHGNKKNNSFRNIISYNSANAGEMSGPEMSVTDIMRNVNIDCINLRIQSLRLTPERKVDYFLQKYNFVMTK